MFPIRDAGDARRVFRPGNGRLTAKVYKLAADRHFRQKRQIYGLDMAASAIRTKDMAVIVEGYMDVIMAHQYGFNNVVASMGTAITEKHINILKKLTKILRSQLDPDKAGEEAMTHMSITKILPRWKL